jgi:hypothetical protein
MLARGYLMMSALLLAVCGRAIAQPSPGAGRRPNIGVCEPPEAVEMWERSATNPLALFAYLDREAVRKSLEPRHYDSEKLANLLLDLESMAVERLGDIGGVGLITRLEEYVGRKVAAKEWDAATTARLTIERIRLRAKGRDAYVQAMIDWVQSPEPVPPTGDSEQPPERSYEQQSKDYWRRVIDGARALGVVQATEAVPVLIAKRQAPGWNNTHLGFWLVRALARIGDPRALETMKQQLLLFAWYVQSAQYPLEPEEPDVAWAYWQTRTRGMTQERTIQELIGSLADDAPPHLLGTDGTLELIGGPAVPELVNALTRPPRGPRPEWAQCEAARVLGKLRAGEAVAPLRGLLRTGSGITRSASADALGRIGDRSAVPDLMQVAAEPNRSLQLSALDALESLADTRAEQPVLALVRSSPDAAVRGAAARTLGKVGTSASVPTLRELLAAESDRDVRNAIERTIKDLAAE